MRVSVALSDVTVRGCMKPSCLWNHAPLHRHHKRHQALWLGPWAHRGAEPQWNKFVARYHEFREADIVVLCSFHHAEIHSIYDKIIAEDSAKLALPLYLYSWAQGRRLMDKLEAECLRWLGTETPGIDPANYGATRRLRWRILRKEAKKKFPKAKRPPKKLRRKRRR